MENLNLIDGLVVLLVLISALLAYSRGLVREIMAIAGWVAAAVLAFIFAPQLMPLVKEIPMVGPILADSCELAIIASFATVFAVALVILSFFTPLLSALIDKTAASRLDRGFGLLFGILRGLALVAIAFFAYQSVLSTETFAVVDQSQSARIFFSDIAQNIEERRPERALGWITTQYEQLVAVCEA